MNKTLLIFTIATLALTGCGEERGNSKEPKLIINNNINAAPLPQPTTAVAHPTQAAKTKVEAKTIATQPLQETTAKLEKPIFTTTTSPPSPVPQPMLTVSQPQIQESGNAPNINKKINNLDNQADNKSEQINSLDTQTDDVLPAKEALTPNDPLWHPEPRSVELPPEPVKAAPKKIPETLTPVIRVRDNEFPTKNSILDATLNEHYDEAVTALWQQDGKAEPLATCDLAGAKNTCHLELNKLELNSNPIRLCLDNGNCDTIVLPSVKFVGQLNYKGQVTAEPKGFSKDLNIGWYHYDTNDVSDAIDDDNLLTDASDSLHIKLQSTKPNADLYVHEYLFFCLTDNANHWPRQCFNVGAQASHANDMVDLLSTLHEDNSLVGGALAKNNDNPAIRRIGPVPALATSRNETIYRPLTQAELASIKVRLHPKYVSFDRSSIYPQLAYKNEKYRKEKYFDYWQFGDAKSLCSGQNMASLVPSIDTLKELDLSELHDSGWPVGKYWSNTDSSTNNEQWILDSASGKKLSEDNRNPTAFIACQIY